MGIEFLLRQWVLYGGHVLESKPSQCQDKEIKRICDFVSETAVNVPQLGFQCADQAQGGFIFLLAPSGTVLFLFSSAFSCA